MRAVAWLGLLLAPCLAQAQPRKVYLRHCGADSRRLLDELATEADPVRAAARLDALLGRAARPASRGLLCEVGPHTLRSLRAELVLRLAAAAPEVRAALARRQGAAATALRGAGASPEKVLARYPLAPAAAVAALELWSDLSERGAFADALALAEELGPLLPSLREGPAALARLALAQAAAGDPAAPATLRALAKLDPERAAVREPAVRAALGRGAAASAGPRGGARLREVARRRLVRTPATRAAAPAVATVLGREAVVVADGTRVWIFDGEGVLQGKAPLGEASTDPLPPTAGLRVRPALYAGLVFAPLVVERWLAPGRARPGADPAIAGRYHCLAALDPAGGRIRWWDGDASEGGSPPGWGACDPAQRELLRRGHAVAVASDGQRVYVALTVKGEEPELWIAAYEALGSRSSLALRAAWPQAAHLLSSERSTGGSGDEPAEAEITAALVLDGRGRLLCTTSVGLAACVRTRDGELLWAQEPRPSPRARRSFRLRRGGRVRAVEEPAPAVLVDGPRGRVAVFLARAALVAARVRDGVTAWERPRGPAQRLLAAGGRAIAYGGVDARAFDAQGKLVGRAAFDLPCAGEAARSGRVLVFPTRRSGSRPLVVLERWILGEGGALRAPVDGRQTVLRAESGPVHLAPIPGGVVATSSKQAVFFRWE